MTNQKRTKLLLDFLNKHYIKDNPQLAVTTCISDLMHIQDQLDAGNWDSFQKLTEKAKEIYKFDKLEETLSIKKILK